ncbi:TIGR03790 family protein [Sulfuriflexus sp.]|uniref:TIGR03790 family protein n=1 Tax=Sulfuriflexus sp. TaxID=2015443 RepID=UPI0028CC5BAD|nr:TIGR03790 family protein [Sulfuriflexus sp.]MDT8405488.1 TIGR03790 family protein [Sulfuriflexus sp.]
MIAMKYLLILLSALLLLPSQAAALHPAEIVVIANSAVSGSVDLAKYYMKQRGIPKENLIRIRTTSKEFCSRDVYNDEIAEPVRNFLRKKADGTSIRCLVTIYGVPLRINPHAWTPDGKKELEALQKDRAKIQKQLERLSVEQLSQAEHLKQQIVSFDSLIEKLNKKDDRAAVDSELTLLWRETYPVKSWVANPYFLGFRQKSLPVAKEDILFVARLDAPSEKIVRRMIDDSLAAETSGLQGTTYIDARWPKADKDKRNAYELYDHSLHQAADKIAAGRAMPMVVNDQQALFQAGEAPDAALYCGWYSVNRYVDAFDWKPGAIGYHIASGECGTLKPGSGKGWCKGMLEDGVAATLGPVGEPYLTAFPPPELFFSLLVDGYYTLAEVYFLSLPYLSWQMVLIGDPLYRPFRNL